MHYDMVLRLRLIDLHAAMRESGATVGAAAGAKLGGSGCALLGAAPRDCGLAQVARQQHPPHRAHIVAREAQQQPTLVECSHPQRAVAEGGARRHGRKLCQLGVHLVEL